MAKVVTTRYSRTFTVHYERNEIVCSNCGKPSGLCGKEEIKKRIHKDWLCIDCRGGNKYAMKDLCICGHRKHRHNTNGRCRTRYYDYSLIGGEKPIKPVKPSDFAPQEDQIAYRAALSEYDKIKHDCLRECDCPLYVPETIPWRDRPIQKVFQVDGILAVAIGESEARPFWVNNPNFQMDWHGYRIANDQSFYFKEGDRVICRAQEFGDVTYAKIESFDHRLKELWQIIPPDLDVVRVIP